MKLFNYVLIVLLLSSCSSNSSNNIEDGLRGQVKILKESIYLNPSDKFGEILTGELFTRVPAMLCMVVVIFNLHHQMNI